MIPHEEGVVRRPHRAKIFDRRLVIGRPVAELDERLLAGKSVEDRGVAQARRELRRKREGGLRRPSGEGCDRRTGAGALQDLSAIEHSPSRPLSFVATALNARMVRSIARKRKAWDEVGC